MFPIAGIAMTIVLLQTLFIAARIRGDLLVCLEEAEELRKRRPNAAAARVDKLHSLGMTPSPSVYLSKVLVGYRGVILAPRYRDGIARRYKERKRRQEVLTRGGKDAREREQQD
jgi:hypothetical protein